MTTKYSISIKTSDAYTEAGTDATVKLEMVGENGLSTGWLTLDHFFSDDFERGRIDRFHMKAKDVGLPVLVRINLDKKGKKDEWLCDRIVVNCGGQSAEFPVYDWISDKQIEVATGTATLPQKTTNTYLASQRKLEVANKQSELNWLPKPAENSTYWGLPRFVNATSEEELPKVFMVDAIRKKHTEDKTFSGKVSVVLETVATVFNPLDELDDFHRYYKHLDSKGGRASVEGWETDEFFGRTTLEGFAPLSITRCTSIPSGFDVTNDDVSKFLDGKCLDDEMKAGKIYICDSRGNLEGLPRNKTKNGDPIYCPDSICMFHVDGCGRLMPICIQLVAGDRDTLFTPADTKDDWLLAKMYHRCSIDNMQQWLYHFLLTHGAMETFSVALFKNLPRCHPIFKLLRSMLKNIPDTNTGFRKAVMGPTGILSHSMGLNPDVVVPHRFKTFHMNDLIFPKRLKKLGLDDKEALPNYHFRDDGLLLWAAIEKFVTGVINHYYTCDKDVVDDNELQNWTADVAKEGYGWFDSNTRGVPECYKTREELIEMCTTIMFTTTAQHAVVNFSFFECQKMIPNYPPGMRRPPHKRGEANQKRIMESLPDATMTQIVIVSSYVLGGTFSPNEVYIGHFPERLFIDEPVLKLQADFKLDLDNISEKISRRNANLEHPYTSLLPERIPNRIAA